MSKCKIGSDWSHRKSQRNEFIVEIYGERIYMPIFDTQNRNRRGEEESTRRQMIADDADADDGNGTLLKTG